MINNTLSCSYIFQITSGIFLFLSIFGSVDSFYLQVVAHKDFPENTKGSMKFILGTLMRAIYTLSPRVSAGQSIACMLCWRLMYLDDFNFTTTCKVEKRGRK